MLCECGTPTFYDHKTDEAQKGLKFQKTSTQHIISHKALEEKNNHIKGFDRQVLEFKRMNKHIKGLKCRKLNT